MAGTIIIGIAYGLKVQPVNDPNVEIAEKGLHAVSTASSPGVVEADERLSFAVVDIPGSQREKRGSSLGL